MIAGFVQGLTGFAFALWNWIVSQVDTFVASISIMCIPILSLFFGYVLWHEPITINIIIGAAFICSGIISSSLNQKIKKKPETLLSCEHR